MSFSLINYSQQDPVWKSVKIGKSSETIGHVGCALTSVAMLVSGHGYLKTPKRSTPSSSPVAAMWMRPSSGARSPASIRVSSIATWSCAAIPPRRSPGSTLLSPPVSPSWSRSIARPNPVCKRTGWCSTKRRVNDYLMLDPWPHSTESGQEVKLLPRYSHGKPLKQSITAVIFYECLQSRGRKFWMRQHPPNRPYPKNQVPTRIPVSVHSRSALQDWAHDCL